MCVQSRGVDHPWCDQHARQSTSFVDRTVDLPWRNFLSRVWDSYREKCPYFVGCPNFLRTQGGTGGRQPACQIPARFVRSFRYNTGLWQMDGHNTHMMSWRWHIPRNSIASSSKTEEILVERAANVATLTLALTFCNLVSFSLRPLVFIFPKFIYHPPILFELFC